MKTIFCWGAEPHRHEVGNLFRTGAENNVLGLAEPDEIIKLEDSKETNTIIERLKSTERYAFALSYIDSIREFKLFISKSNKEESNKVNLMDQFAEVNKSADQVQRSVAQTLCRPLGGFFIFRQKKRKKYVSIIIMYISFDFFVAITH